MMFKLGKLYKDQKRQKDDHEWWVDKYLEGGSHDLFWAIIMTFSWRDEKTTKALSHNNL